VPSITELLVALGLAEALVGRTGFCIHPRQLLRRVPKLGGTKGFDADKLRALEPTHVIVNIDENRREEVEALSDCVPHLIVTHPLEARDNLDLYRLLGGVFGREAAAEALCADFENAWQALRAATELLPREKVLYLIWREPWLGVARDTYISRMLAAAGWDTLPVDSRLRYPEIDLPALARAADIVFLSSEPYPFREKHRQLLATQLPEAALRPDRRRDGFLVRQPGDRRTGLSARLADPPWATLNAVGTANPREIDQHQAQPAGVAILACFA
jgi:ABC-type Fe3+-hydroxamate transport system substrate-binding protein